MYKAVINLVPNPSYIERVGKWSEDKRQTITYSVDDALSLVNNAGPGSIIQVWNANYFSAGDLERIESWEGIDYYHLPQESPYIKLYVDELPKSGEYNSRPLNAVHFLTIHHTVGWRFDDSLERNAEIIAQSHSAKWPGIGYHFLIGPRGRILQVNRLTTKSYHCGSYDAPGDENYVSVGIALGGDFRKAPPPEPQLYATSSLVEDLRSLFVNYLAVLPHKRMPGAATICPGTEGLEEWLKKVENWRLWIP